MSRTSCPCGHMQSVEFDRPGYEVLDTGEVRDTVLRLSRCEACGLVRQTDFPFEDYGRFYGEDYAPNKSVYSYKDYGHDLEVARSRLSRYGIGADRKKVLDVGCGSGAFVDVCNSSGMEACGCDIASYSYAENKEFVYYDSFEDVHFPTDHFGVVTCHDALEHVVDLKGFVGELFRVTEQDGGRCYVEVPKFHDSAGEHHWKLEHVWFFDESQLRKLLEDAGFSVEKVDSPIPSKLTFHCVKPKQERAKILLPPGVGDVYWELVKLRAFLEREKLGLPDVYIACKRRSRDVSCLRAFPLIEMVPFVNATWETADIDKAGYEVWDEAYRRKGRTHLPGVLGMDYFVSHNGHLGLGADLENTNPDLTCEWDLPLFVSLEQRRFEERCRKDFGRYVVFYFVFHGTYKHWSRQFSPQSVTEYINDLREQTGCTPVIAGAEWDRQCPTLNKLVGNIEGAVDMRGSTSLDELFGMMKGAEAVVGYPSGLTIMGAALHLPTLIIWNKYYNRNFVRNSCPPSTWQKTYFAVDTNRLTVDRLLGVTNDMLRMTSDAPRVPEETTEERSVIEEVGDEWKDVYKEEDEKVLTITTVLKSGGPYRIGYIHKMREALEKHVGVRFEFLPMSDVDLPAKGQLYIPLKHNWPGWWSKMELFRPGLFCGTVLYLDLDTMIVDNIDHMVVYPHKFSMLRPFNPKRRHGKFASGIMAWSGDVLASVYDEFCRNSAHYIKNVRGDQNIITQFAGREPDVLQEIQPGIVSYKRDCVDGVPQGSRIVCFHGRPRPHEIGWSLKWKK